MKESKKYLFSTQKHAHDIEFYKNHLYCVMHDMTVGEIPWDEKRFDKIEKMYYGELQELYDAVVFGSQDGKVCYLTGKQIGLAKKIVIWAQERRVNGCIKSGKTEYIQYC